MKRIKSLLLLLVLNVVFCAAVSIRQRVRSSLSDQSNSSLNESEYASQEHYFEQNLDHFNPDSFQKWNQRYWSYPSYYKPGGPAFLLINGESASPINWNTKTPESWLSYAKTLNAHCFSLEHRFYGKSWPTNGNMVHLSSEQALADVANFIKTTTEQYKLPQDTKWFVFGKGYSGSLAAWARLKFPYLVYAAIASSAPLQISIFYDEYYQIIEESLKSYDPKCVESISSATREIASLINSNSSSLVFDSCGDEKNFANEAKSLIHDVVDIISVAVQYNDSANFDIPAVCNILINHNGTKLEALAKLRKLHKQNAFYNTAWNYQTCTEFGFFSTFNKTTSLFHINDQISIEDDIKETCEEFFGPSFSIADLDERNEHTNMVYGGVDFNTGNTLFIHGSLDPWYRAGLHQTKPGAAYQTIFIKGTSHGADMLPASDTDSKELKEARQKTLEILKKWLNKKSV